MRGWLLWAVLAVFVGACATAGEEGGDDDNPDAGTGKTETDCIDKVDNDDDGDTDCDDADCASHPVCNPETNCANGGDDDFDGATDCQDPDCDGVGYCEYQTEVSCRDDKDNDGDGLSDCADPNCAGDVTCIPETNCADGEDDDEDGQTDCADFDCDGVGICEYGAETTCDDGEDNDGDGDTDCDDLDCSVLAECVLLCPSGTTPSTLTASDVPVSIPDAGSAQATASATGPGIVRKAVVQISITHTFDGDLVIGLQPPSGADIVLSNRNGSLGENYTDTVFTDEAATPISSGSAPFTGTFQPDEPLSGAEGYPVEGTWALTVSDEAAFDTGSITAFELHLCTCDGTPGCEFGAACQDESDNDGDGDVDCDDADCAAVIQCIPESACDDGTDNDLDGNTDCADSDCDGDGICEYGAETTCNDGEDNDGDGAADCADVADCADFDPPYCVAEDTCFDGDDNDGDGLTDCADPGCAADAACEPTGETLCADSVDNDNDGLTDCEEPGCALVCALSACGGGEVAVGLAATDLPQAINDSSTTTSTVTVVRSGTVSRVAVRFSATHSYTGDLDITLISPAATAIDLSSDNGSGGDDYSGTIFIDSATTPITSGEPPFSGSFQPEQPLSGLAGEQIDGDWILQVYDDASLDTGTFTLYELALCVVP